MSQGNADLITEITIYLGVLAIHFLARITVLGSLIGLGIKSLVSRIEANFLLLSFLTFLQGKQHIGRPAGKANNL